MANMIENLGLSFLMDTEEDARNFIGSILAEPTKTLVGYTGNPVIRRTFKDAEFCVRTELAEEGKLEVCGIDTHCAGSMIWNTKVFSEMSYDDGDYNSRLVLVQKENGGGGAILNVINADVIPSYICGDPLKVQVVGFPLAIEVFETEEEYEKAASSYYKDKQAIRPAIGSIFPIGIMHRKDEPITNGLENLVCGRFKDGDRGNFVISDEHKIQPFVRLLIETEFGELELDVSRDMLPSSIAYDSIILASVVISADAGIFEYENGIIRDEENDLRVLRQAISRGESDRLKPILADGCKYTSEIGKWEKTGSLEIVNLFKYINKERELHYKTHIGTISENEEANIELEYKPGKRVLVLENEEGKLESLMILDYDDEGQVCRIKVAAADNYKFGIDGKYERIEMPLEEDL